MPNRDGSRTSVKHFFGDGEHDFDIVDAKWSLLIELEKTVGSVLPFFHRMQAGDFRVTELRELIRLALIGGGKTPGEAHRLVGTYFDLSPIAEHLPLAVAITGAALFGVDPDGEVVNDAAA